MKSAVFFLSLGILAAALPGIAGAQSPASMSLSDVYQEALKKTEAPAIQESLEVQANEHVKQARGAIFPTLGLFGSYTRQDAPTSTTGVASSFQRPDQTTVKLGVTQPLFRGLREFGALRVTEAQQRSQSSLTQQSKLTVYSSVAQAFYNVLAAQRDIQDLTELLELSSNRVKDLSQRARIGRSRRGELYTAEAQVATVNAQLVAARQLRDQARDALALAAGIERNTQLVDSTVMPQRLDSIQYYLGQIEDRPDVQSQKELETAATESVSVARGENYPSADFTGNYYFYRTGILQDTKWDVGLTVSIPLFTGGIVSSQIREAAEREKQSQLSLSQTRRGAEHDIRTAYEGIDGYLNQLKALNQALVSSNKSYKEEERDYRLGLVTHLEVIQALNALSDATRSVHRTEYQAKASYVSLQAALGRIPR